MSRVALALLNVKHDAGSQWVVQELADRFAASDAAKAMAFAEEAAVRARGLNQPDRTTAIAQAGAVLVKLGRADAGRKLIDEAAHDAAQLPILNRDGYCACAGRRCPRPLRLEAGDRAHRANQRRRHPACPSFSRVNRRGDRDLRHEAGRRTGRRGRRPGLLPRNSKIRDRLRDRRGTARRGDQDHRGHQAQPLGNAVSGQRVGLAGRGPGATRPRKSEPHSLIVPST